MVRINRISLQICLLIISINVFADSEMRLEVIHRGAVETPPTQFVITSDSIEYEIYRSESATPISVATVGKYILQDKRVAQILYITLKRALSTGIYSNTKFGSAKATGSITLKVNGRLIERPSVESEILALLPLVKKNRKLQHVRGQQFAVILDRNSRTIASVTDVVDGAATSTSFVSPQVVGCSLYHKGIWDCFKQGKYRVILAEPLDSVTVSRDRH